jgi:hypothetical protein
VGYALGVFGQVMWMFGCISMLILLGRRAKVHNFARGMAGAPPSLVCSRCHCLPTRSSSVTESGQTT